MSQNDIVGFEFTPNDHVATLASIFTRLRAYKVQVSGEMSRYGSDCLDFFGHEFVSDGARTNDEEVVALTCMPKAISIK